MFNKRAITVVVLVFFSLLNLGMGSTKDAVKEPEVKILWPPPPFEPRIEYVRTIMTPDDIGAKKGFFKKAWEFLAGRDIENRLMKPFGVYVDEKGGLYIADTALLAVHVFDMQNHKYRLIEGTDEGRFASPVSVVTDESGRILVSDSIQKQVYIFSDRGKYIGKLGPPGKEGFLRPTGLAVNRTDGLLYVVDTLACRVHVYTTKGQYRSSFGKRGEADGEFNYPTFISTAYGGDLYVSDSINFRIQRFDKNGKFLSKFGKHGDGTGDMGNPRGVAVDSDENIYVIDTLFEAFQIFDSSGKLLLVFGKPGKEPGSFMIPSDIMIDSNDLIYVADTYNSRVQVFRYLHSDKTDKGPDKTVNDTAGADTAGFTN